jgi:hypothetical protein
VEVDEDSNSPTAFHLVGDPCCVVRGSIGILAFDSPARVLVPCPSAVLEETPDVSVDCTGGMAVGVNVIGAEIVLQDVVGHQSSAFSFGTGCST